MTKIRTSKKSSRPSSPKKVSGKQVSDQNHVEAERQKFAALADRCTEFIGICDMQFRPFYVNEAGLRLVGLDSLAQAMSVRVLEFFFPEDQAYFQNDFLPRVLRDEQAEIEIRFRHFKTGAPIWMIYNAFIIKDASGSPVGIATFSQNITEQKNTEQVLREKEERLRAALTASGTGTFRWDIQTNSLDWDENLDRLFGLAPGQTVRSLESFISKVHRDEQAGVIQRCLRCAKEGADFEMEFRVVWPDGSTHWLYDKGKTFFDDAGQPLYMTGACVDVTERKLAEQTLSVTNAKFQKLFESDLIGIGFPDRFGGFSEANDAFLQMVGYTREELQAGLVRWDKMTPDEYFPLDVKGIAEAEVRGSCTPYEKEYVRKDGTRVPILVGYTLLEGSRDRFVAFILDLTEQRRAEAAIRNREKQFRALATSLPQLIWVTNASGDNEYCNERFMEYTGRDPQQMLGYAWRDIIHPDDLAETEARWRLCVATGQPYEMEYRLRRSDGSYRAFLARAIPVRDQNGQIERWIGSSTDIHDQKNAEEALRRSEKLAVTGRLASSIAHEINNPLMAVTSLVYLIEQDAALSDSTRQYAKSVQNELARVTHIVTQTLRFSRSSTRASDADLREIIDSVLSLFQVRLDAANISVQLDYGADTPFNGYPDDLRQVIANLVSNAHDAMRDGGTLRIRVREALAWDGSGVRGIRMTFADNGIGIDPGFKKRIFEPFTTTNKETGTGLGLWVTNEIVQQHNGRIRVRSSIQPARRGTTFCLFFPFVSANKSTAGDAGAIRKTPGVSPFPPPQRLANYQ